MRKALLIIALAGFACGSQETSTSPAIGGEEAKSPPVSAIPVVPAAQPPAAQPPAAQPPSEATTPEETAATAEPAEVKTCLGLVQEGKYAEALVACQAAASLYPDNTAVAAALAKAGAAKMTEGAAGAAGAASAAAGATGDAAKGIKMP